MKSLIRKKKIEAIMLTELDPFRSALKKFS